MANAGGTANAVEAPETLENGENEENGERPPADPLSEFARWAMEQTGSRTLGEAIAEAGKLEGENREWRRLAELPLDRLAKPREHPYQTIRKWVNRLEPRRRDIVLGRMTGTGWTMTLEEIAGKLGITRERVRQLELKTKTRLDRLIRSMEGLPATAMIMAVADELGTAGPEARVEHLLRPPPGTPDFRPVILEWAGPYRRLEDGWLVLMEKEKRDPTPGILRAADGCSGRIDMEKAGAALREWGVPDELHAEWLLRNPRVRMFQGVPVRWPENARSRVILGLQALGRPAGLEEIMLLTGETCTRGSVINGMNGDRSIIRAGTDRWALAEWKLPEYRGAARSIRDILEAEGGACSAGFIVDTMRRNFGAIETTTLAYCMAPMFVKTGEMVRIRTEDDPPFRCRVENIRSSRGVFDLGDGRAARAIEVSREQIRGSGGTLSEAAGAILGIQVHDEAAFTSPQGDTVRVTFPETGIQGPLIGSMRDILERLEAREGDILTLAMSRAGRELAVTLTRRGEMTREWRTVRAITGLEESAGLEALARAMHCETRMVPHWLRQRHDPLARCVPGMG